MSEGLLTGHKPSQESGQPPPQATLDFQGLTWSLPAIVFSPQPLPDLAPGKSSNFLLGLSLSLLTPWRCLTVVVSLPVLGAESAISKAPGPSPPPGSLPCFHAQCLSHPHSAEVRQREGRGRKAALPCTHMRQLPETSRMGSEADLNHRLLLYFLLVRG